MAEAKLRVQRLFEEPWKGNWDMIDEVVATGYVGHDSGLPEPVHGPDGLRELLHAYSEAFPDARTHRPRADRRGRQGGLALERPRHARRRDRGDHPTGKEVTVSGLTISTLEEARWSSSGPPGTAWACSSSSAPLPAAARSLTRAGRRGRSTRVVGRRPRASYRRAHGVGSRAGTGRTQRTTASARPCPASSSSPATCPAPSAARRCRWRAGDTLLRPRRLLEYRMFQLRDEVAGFEDGLRGYLDSAARTLRAVARRARAALAGEQRLTASSSPGNCWPMRSASASAVRRGSSPRPAAPRP